MQFNHISSEPKCSIVLQKGEYRFISEMLEDFNLMFDNAQQYNRPDSRIYRDAVKLQRYVQAKAEEITAADEEVRVRLREWLEVSEDKERREAG